MTTEKDIKQFFEKNRPSVSAGSERFMDELVRQIDLLPTPAKFQKPDKEQLRSKYALLEQLENRSRRLDVFTVISSVMIAAVLCLILVVLTLYASDSMPDSRLLNMIISYSYILIPLIFSATTLLSFNSSGLFKI